MPNVSIPGVGVVAFPDTMATDAINNAAAGLYAKANQPAEPPRAPLPKAKVTPMGLLSAAFNPQSSPAEMQSGAVRGAKPVGPELKKMVGRSGPDIAALAATALVPEAAPLGWLLRPLLAGATSAATDPLGQMIAGEQPTLKHAAIRGGINLGLQGIGEGVAAVAKGTGDAALLDATGASKAARKASPGIDQTILRERVPVGPGTSGQEAINARAAENAKAMQAAEAAHPMTHSADDILAQVDHEIAQLKQSAHPEDAADAVRLQARRDAFAAKNPNGLTNDQLDRAVRSSQQRARGTYTKDVNGQPVTMQTTPDEQMYHRLFARQGRTELRKVPGVAETKDRAQELIAAEKVYSGAEAARPPALPNIADPTRVGPTLLRRSLLDPAFESRAGLLLNNPALLAKVRPAPLALKALTSQGGSR